MCVHVLNLFVLSLASSFYLCLVPRFLEFRYNLVLRSDLQDDSDKFYSDLKNLSESFMWQIKISKDRQNVMPCRKKSSLLFTLNW